MRGQTLDDLWANTEFDGHAVGLSPHHYGAGDIFDLLAPGDGDIT